MKPSDILELLPGIFEGLQPHYVPAIQAKLEAYELNQPPSWFLLAVSHDFLPENTSAERFYVRTPYTNPQNFEDGLKALADRGLLEPAGEGEYRMTDTAKAQVDAVGDLMENKLAALAPIATGDLKQMADTLLQVVEAALAAPEPAAKPHVTVNRASDRGPDAPPLQRLLQYVADLNSFRDDAHISAWSQYDVSGHGFEAFSYLWREGDLTLAELVEKLPETRGYEADDYRAALNELVQKGWLTLAGDTYHVTDEGKAIREKIEADTDRMYYTAWSVLSDDAVAALGDIMTRLRDALKAMQPTEASA